MQMALGLDWPHSMKTARQALICNPQGNRTREYLAPSSRHGKDGIHIGLNRKEHHFCYTLSHNLQILQTTIATLKKKRFYLHKLITFKFNKNEFKYFWLSLQKIIYLPIKYVKSLFKFFFYICSIKKSVVVHWAEQGKPQKYQ